MSNKLNINSLEQIGGVLNFDGSSYVVYSDYDPGLIGTMDIEFKMWLDNNSGYAATVFAIDPSSQAGIDYVSMYILDSSIYITQTSPFSQNRIYPMGDISNQILNISIRKSEDNQVGPVFFKINGVEQTSSQTGGIPNISSFSTGVLIGRGITTSTNTPDILNNGTVWDFKITEVSTGNVIRYWKGYPGGNTNEAWIDQQGSDVSLAVIDIPAGHVATTRNIEGTEGSSSIFDLNNKLTLNLQASSRKLFIGEIIEAPLFSFVSDSFSSPINIQTNISAGTLEWDMGDGSIINDNSFEHTYSSSGNKTVKLYAGTTSGLDSIIWFYLDPAEVQGSLDFSNFVNLERLAINDSEDFTDLTLPDEGVYLLRAQNSGLTGTLDLSNWGGPSAISTALSSGGLIDLRNSSNLTQIINPNTDVSISAYHLADCNITGALDVSGFTNMSGYLFCYNNSNLTSILLPDGNGNNFRLEAYSCNLTGILDVSSFNLNISLRVDNNPNLTSILLPTFSDNNINTFNVKNTSITSLDVSGLVGLRGSFSAEDCTQLTSINFSPDCSGTFSSFDMRDCEKLEILDVSSLIRLTGNFWVYSCASLNTIMFPETSSSLNDLNVIINNNKLTGTIDVSALNNLSSFNCNNNSGVQKILFPSSSKTTGQIFVHDCDLQGNLDLSGFSNFQGNFWAMRNSDLLSLTLPSSFGGPFTSFYVDDCSLNQTSIDDIFSKLDSYYSSNSPSTSLTVRTEGGGNASPTDGNSNSNILNLETIFSNAGQTLTITINT